jgi:hypothetical protein
MAAVLLFLLIVRLAYARHLSVTTKTINSVCPKTDKCNTYNHIQSK